MSRQVRRLAVAALALSALVPPPGAAAAPAPVAQPCVEFAVSPAFARDRTAFCVGEERDRATGNTTAIPFFATTDGGRSWARTIAAGLVPPAGSNLFFDMFVSPRYADDRAVYVQLANGLFVSTDAGASFLPVDPLAWSRLTPFVAGAATSDDEVAAHTLIAQARGGAAEGANQSTIIDPTTRVRTPVKGSPGVDKEFVISPRFASDRLAFVVAEHGLGLTRHVRLHGCSIALECSTPLHRFPDRWTYDRLWLAPDFTASKTMYASITTLDGVRTLWWSRDAGRTFVRWRSAERLPHDFSAGTFGLSGEPGTEHLYLRTTGDGERSRGAAPYEQLFLSKDDGATWARVAYGRKSFQQGPRGTMPPSNPGFSGDGETARGLVTAAGGGRLFMIGRSGEGTTYYESVWCTVDHGRRWTRYCAK